MLNSSEGNVSPKFEFASWLDGTPHAGCDHLATRAINSVNVQLHPHEGQSVSSLARCRLLEASPDIPPNSPSKQQRLAKTALSARSKIAITRRGSHQASISARRQECGSTTCRRDIPSTIGYIPCTRPLFTMVAH